ncbi:DUF6163 family protein [Bdellovibrio bacteriovorus]|uniref:DUF6163 family protein n=1 Tax=Bdellovibrio bacteriovorus TaxID=959 RepID=UPI0035A5CA17
MKIYLKIMAACYFIGGLLHVLDVFDLRLKFSEMSFVWKSWILYLLVLDLVAAVGLWQRKSWGTALFLVVAMSQLIAYLGFRNIFGRQDTLIVFHVITLAVFVVLRTMEYRSTRRT